MSSVTERAIKRSNLLITGIQCIVAGVVEWAVVGRFRWYPMYIVNAVALLLLGAGSILCIGVFIRRLIQRKRSGLTVHSAKRYLCAFLQQYRDTNDPDIAGVINALLVLRKAGLLTATDADKKQGGTVQVDETPVEDGSTQKDTRVDDVMYETRVHTKTKPQPKAPKIEKTVEMEKPKNQVLLEDTPNDVAQAETVTVPTAPRRRVVRRH